MLKMFKKKKKCVEGGKYWEHERKGSKKKKKRVCPMTFEERETKNEKRGKKNCIHPSLLTEPEVTKCVCREKT